MTTNVTLHVSVWVEINQSTQQANWNIVTLHVSVWVEIKRYSGNILWHEVTLHVSVWVEIYVQFCENIDYLVTLHVSVWVEIFPLAFIMPLTAVTLHVSVWVEIKIWTLYINILTSRSTWACELKWKYTSLYRSQPCHAPRERVSWNANFYNSIGVNASHAPRERVSWNMIIFSVKASKFVTLHVSVWVEMRR